MIEILQILKLILGLIAFIYPLYSAYTYFRNTNNLGAAVATVLVCEGVFVFVMYFLATMRFKGIPVVLSELEQSLFETGMFAVAILVSLRITKAVIELGKSHE